MDLINQIRARAKADPKTIVLPEGKEKRVIEAAKRITQERIAKIILIHAENLDFQMMEEYAQDYFRLREHKGITLAEAEGILKDPVYYAAMMVREGSADGFVAGASHTTRDVARAAIHCLGADSRIETVSSSFIIILPDCPYGERGVFIFADCGIVPEPTAKQLAQIALSSAELIEKVLRFEPRVAMLSFSTKGSASGRCVEKVREATELVKQLQPNLLVDGELQVDSAIIPEVAKIKTPDSILKGRANVLIFPNLDAGNIAYKLIQRLAKAKAIGPLLQGLNKPCSDLSRGCDVEDIVDAVAVTVTRAQNR